MTVGLLEPLVDLLTANYQYASELQILGMALQGAMAVRAGANKDKKMNWFHAFALTTMLAFGGGWLGFLLMGKPTSMVSGGDLNISACVIAFIIVNYSPLDIGFKILKFLPIKIVITVYAQLFRSGGMIKFIDTAFNEIKATPFYPIPVIGPVVYGTMLGNMGPLALKGFDSYLRNGMPWAFQNGIFIGTFYHLYSHDEKGPIGIYLRGVFKALFRVDALGLDDRTFAHVVTAGFMQVAGILMLPQFYGPSFSLIRDPLLWILTLVPGPVDTDTPISMTKDARLPQVTDSDENVVVPHLAKKKKKKKKAKKKIA